MVSFTSLFAACLMVSAGLAVPHQGHSKLHRRVSSGKRGAAYNDASLISILSHTGAVGWAYNWWASPGGTIPTGVEYVPQLWGQKAFSTWNNDVESCLASGSRHILGFNEPDEPQQANLSPSNAAQLYQQYISPYKGRASLGTPAVTNGGGNMGLNWMQQYFDSCGGNCNADFMVIHWYNDASQVDDFKAHVTQAIALAAKYGMSKIWITEFGATGSSDAQAAFLNVVLPWLDSQPGVERYAYFMDSNGYLLTGNSLSPIGSAYVS